MKKIQQTPIFAVMLAALFCTVSTVRGQSVTENFIRTRIPREAIATETQLNQLTPNKDKVQQTIAYFDGLGRPSQNVLVKGSPTGRDLIQPFTYDQFGREGVKYLPYVASVANSDGTYKPAALTEQSSFYVSPLAWSAPGW